MTLALEDGQTALETLLTQRIGAAGARLHAGRSRNDQVLAALRLYLRDVVDELGDGADAAADALDALASCAGRDRVAGLHAHAAGDAVDGPALGGRLRRRAA